MKELILGLFGGGAVVQAINYLLTLRQNRRQMNATALGTEVEALERTIKVIYENLERQNLTHRSEVESLQKELAALRKRCRELELEVMRLRGIESIDFDNNNSIYDKKEAVSITDTASHKE